MANYKYKEGYDRILEIVDNELTVVEQNKLPNDSEFTFENGYYSWVTAIFVDIRESTELFTDEDKEKVSKMIRSFTSEVIEILREGDNLREIGIRGDCVYAIYTTPKKKDIFEAAQKTFYINTFMKMLNKVFKRKDFPEIKVGVGMSTAKELVVKAGRKGVDINNKVWIGDAVTKASNLSSLGNKGGRSSLVFSALSYDNFIETLVEESGEKSKDWFTKVSSTDYGTYYYGNIIKMKFNEWIENEI